MTEAAKVVSPVDLVTSLLDTIASGGKLESQQVLDLGKAHDLPWVPKALEKALAARKEVAQPKVEEDLGALLKARLNSIAEKERIIVPLRQGRFLRRQRLSPNGNPASWSPSETYKQFPPLRLPR